MIMVKSNCIEDGRILFYFNTDILIGHFYSEPENRFYTYVYFLKLLPCKVSG